MDLQGYGFLGFCMFLSVGELCGGVCSNWLLLLICLHVFELKLGEKMVFQDN